MITFGLLGFPLIHSFSRRFFTEKFQREQLDAEYLNFELPSIDELPSLLASHPALQGFNVTIPYKEQIIPFLDELSEEAATIGAVNCVCIERKSGAVRLKGYNADVIGFVRSIQPLLQSHHQHALVLGTGGAYKAVCYGLRRLGIQPMLVSRHPRQGVLTYQDISEETLRQYTVIVNCSPVGTFPHSDECPDIPYQYLTHQHLLYDLVYNPDKTLFLQRGEQQKAVIKNGLEMLHLQALASWEFWNHSQDTTYP